MALDVTPGGAHANSYASLVEAEAYFAGRLYADAWEEASAGDKERALRTACRRIERLALAVPARGAATQVLKFPRAADLDSSGALCVPQAVKDAQCEEALALLANGEENATRRALQGRQVAAYAVTGLSEQYGGADAGPLDSPEARDLLEPFLLQGGMLATSDSAGGQWTPATAMEDTRPVANEGGYYEQVV